MIFGMLRNTATNRFHPIVFRPAPMPGGADASLKALRYKSFGHHTEGFDTREVADAHVRESCVKEGHLASGATWEWDGEGIPAMVGFFDPVALGTSVPEAPYPA